MVALANNALYDFPNAIAFDFEKRNIHVILYDIPTFRNSQQTYTFLYGNKITSAKATQAVIFASTNERVEY